MKLLGVAAALGAMVLSILRDPDQPDIEDLDDEDDVEDEPRRRTGMSSLGGGRGRKRRKAKAKPQREADDDDNLNIDGPREGESADQFVNRATAEVAVVGGRKLWRALQKLSR